LTRVPLDYAGWIDAPVSNAADAPIFGIAGRFLIVARLHPGYGDCVALQ
jgi:hypothetical protein